jgi:hypothetical protein
MPCVITGGGGGGGGGGGVGGRAGALSFFTIKKTTAPMIASNTKIPIFFFLSSFLNAQVIFRAPD